MFSLAKKGASLRVTVWRKLQRYGALPLGNSGYFLPNTDGNRERFEWLATAVRTEGGEASVLEVQSIDNCSFTRMKQRFSDARAGDYRELLKDLRNPAFTKQSSRITRLRQRFQDIVSIDFFGSPLREQVEHALNSTSNIENKISRNRDCQCFTGRVSKPSMGHSAAAGCRSSDLRLADPQVH